MKTFKFLQFYFCHIFSPVSVLVRLMPISVSKLKSRKKLVSVLKKFCGLRLGLERFGLDYSPGSLYTIKRFCSVRGIFFRQINFCYCSFTFTFHVLFDLPLFLCPYTSLLFFTYCHFPFSAHVHVTVLNVFPLHCLQHQYQLYTLIFMLLLSLKLLHTLLQRYP